MTAFLRSTHWLGSAMCLALTCCASTPESSGFRIVDVFRSDKTDEERAWHALLERSDVRQVGSDRLIVEAWGAMGTSMEIVELRMLARAGAAADRLGKSHFAIVHIRDRNQPVSNGLFGDSIFGADEVWIGTYEALVRSRYERDYGFATRQWLGPALSAVIVALDPDDLGQKEAFEALNMYHTLNRNELVR
ncbi:MAG: hypothetical protein AAGA72_08335 [Pseudomonadota bacterium]